MFGLKNKAKKKKFEIAMMRQRLITVSDSNSIIAEQFRTIRTNIKFTAPDTGIKTLLVTSSTPGEGKSTNAANLGVVFAQEGKKVLIVDADMRKPTLHHTFGIFNTKGLSTILSNQDEFYFVIQETPIDGLYVLPSGPVPPNPSELLSSKKLDDLLEEMKQNYDMIIFDAPPLLAVSDAQVLSHQCDGTILIIHSGVAEKEDVLKGQSILAASQAKILGVVLNQYKMPKKRKYYYEYYG
jgi:protein-tyrosine kinase